MNSLLLRILMSKQGKWQFLFAGAGFWIGLVIMLLSVQVYLDLKTLVERRQKDEKSEYIIINKEVSLLNTLDKTISGFTADEIQALRNQEYFLSVGEFRTNNFSIEANLQMQLGFSTDIFFESVPDPFIDNRPEEFKWEEEKGFLPVIVSSEFLNLYNFGYAMTQGLPQLPKAAIEMVPFDITISGNGKKRKLAARVIGFTDRIQSVLVPWDFMEWANSNYTTGKPGNASRIILEVKDSGDERIQEFLAANKYITNQERLNTDKAGALLNIVISITGFIGLLFVALSFIIFVINFQLILSRAKAEINILLNLGYSFKTISRILNTQLGLILVIVTLAAYVVIYIVVDQLYQFLSDKGIALDNTISLPVVLLGMGVLITLLLVNRISMKYSLK